jgi:K+-sensing histidine kinase KdpD
MWLIPMVITASIALFIVSIYRSINSISLCIAIWLTQIALISNEMIENIIQTSNITLLFILAISTIIMINSLKVFYKRTINYLDFNNYDF